MNWYLGLAFFSTFIAGVEIVMAAMERERFDQIRWVLRCAMSLFIAVLLTRLGLR